MKIAITGATGFVGRVMVPALAARGHTVRAGARTSTPRTDGIAAFGYGDLDTAVDWARFVDGMDAVVHLAGIAHNEGVADARYDQVNRAQTAALATAAARAGVGRVVYASSVKAQSDAIAPGVLTEADPPRPVDAYGRSKLAAEVALAESGAAYTALRPVLVYGPGVKGNLAALHRLARLPVPLPFGAIRTRRSLCSLDGLVAAVDTVLATDAAANQVYLVADRAPIALCDLVAALRRGLGRRPLLVPVPRVAIEYGLRAAGRRAMWDRLGGELVVDASKLAALGWTAPDTAAALTALAPHLDE
jgi:nucleoside-diphosphate-sugar epimerase